MKSEKQPCLHASAIDIPPPKKNQQVSYWYEAFVAVSLWLGVQSPRSGLDWHGNWHRSSLALSGLEPTRELSALQTHKECLGPVAVPAWPSPQFTRNNLDIRGIPENAKFVT